MVIRNLLRITGLLLAYTNLMVIIAVVSSAIHYGVRDAHFHWSWLIWSYIANLVTLAIASELKYPLK
jgi:hypothetical protein